MNLVPSHDSPVYHYEHPRPLVTEEQKRAPPCGVSRPVGSQGAVPGLLAEDMAKLSVDTANQRKQNLNADKINQSCLDPSMWFEASSGGSKLLRISFPNEVRAVHPVMVRNNIYQSCLRMSPLQASSSCLLDACSLRPLSDQWVPQPVWRGYAFWSCSAIPRVWILPGGFSWGNQHQRRFLTASPHTRGVKLFSSCWDCVLATIPLRSLLLDPIFQRTPLSEVGHDISL